MFKKKMMKTRQLWKREFSVVDEGLDEDQVIAFVDDLIAHNDISSSQLDAVSHSETGSGDHKSPSDLVRAISGRTVTGTEYIVASIKVKTQKGAMDEAARIIAKVRQEADELRQQARSESQKKMGDSPGALNVKAQLIEEEAKQKVKLLLLQERQAIEQEIKEEYKEALSRLLSSLSRGNEEPPKAETSNYSQSEPKPVQSSKGPEAGLSVSGKMDAKKPSKTKKTGRGLDNESKPSLEEEVTATIRKAKEPKMPSSSQKSKQNWLASFKLTKKTGKTRQAEDSGKQTKIEARLVTREKAEQKNTNQEPKTRPGLFRGKLNLPTYLKRGKKIQKTHQESQGNHKPEEITQTGATQPVTKVNTEVSRQPDKVATKVQEIDMASAIESIAKRTIETPALAENQGIPQILDKIAVYNGEIELAIAVPVDPAAVSALYTYLQATPDVKVLYTRGSWDRGTVITVTLDKPLPFIGMVSKIAGLKISPGIPQKENQPKWTSGSLLNAKKKETTRIYLTLKSE